MSLSLEGANSGSFCLTKAGLAIGSTASQLSTAAAATAVIDGVHQTSKAAQATFLATVATGFTLATIPLGSGCAFGVWLDTSGNLRVTQGPINPMYGSADVVAPPPNPGGGYAPIGVAKVFNGPTAAGVFTFGTTNFNATGVTTTYRDLFAPLNAAF